MRLFSVKNVMSILMEKIIILTFSCIWEPWKKLEPIQLRYRHLSEIYPREKTFMKSSKILIFQSMPELSLQTLSQPLRNQYPTLPPSFTLEDKIPFLRCSKNLSRLWMKIGARTSKHWSTIWRDTLISIQDSTDPYHGDL